MYCGLSYSWQDLGSFPKNMGPRIKTYVYAFVAQKGNKLLKVKVYNILKLLNNLYAKLSNVTQEIFLKRRFQENVFLTFLKSI